MRARSWILVVVGLLLAVAGAARAGGFEVAEQSAAAGGTAGAATAREGDPGAAWYNPAALADGGGLRVGLGLLAAMPSVSASAMDGSWSAGSQNGPATPPHLHVSEARGRLAWGVAVGVPFGGGVSWPEDWQGRSEIISSQLEVFRVAPFVAWNLGSVRVAGGLHADFGRLRLRRSLDFVDTEGDVRLDLDGRGYGVDLACWWQARRDLAVGLSYKSRDTLGLHGGADFTAPDEFSAKTSDQHVGAQMHLPDRIGLGAAWRHGALLALADLEVVTWSVNQELVLDFENEATPDVVQANRWRTTVGLRTGVEWTAKGGTWLRGGAFYDPSPAQAKTLAPSSPDANRLGVTLGAGRRLRRDLTLDGFYEYMQLLGRQTESMDSLQARYSGHAHLLGLDLRYVR
ncbi:MAG TPA: outer membrane protein transport protein [Kofleriaceae bacterium]|nr:outer membrane protein transport protein [Kofleriaceae bacterium]